jgi:hypothetical protein
VDLNRITAFVRIVDAESFTATAAALGVRKSSVSRSVAALEADLGICLLQRATRRLSITQAGRAYYERARDALAGLVTEIPSLTPGDLGPQAADAAHEQLNLHPHARGAHERRDHVWIDERVDLEHEVTAAPAARRAPPRGR